MILLKHNKSITYNIIMEQLNQVAVSIIKRAKAHQFSEPKMKTQQTNQINTGKKNQMVTYSSEVTGESSTCSSGGTASESTSTAAVTPAECGSVQNVSEPSVPSSGKGSRLRLLPVALDQKNL